MRTVLNRRLTAGLLLVAVLFSGGCGIKLAYNNADRLVRWWASDYIDLNSEQRAYLRAAVGEFMYWHRTTQLARYRDGLLRFAEQMSGPISADEFAAVLDEMEAWSEPIAMRGAPIAAQVLLSLDAEQLVDFRAALAESNLEYVEEAERSLAKRQREQAKDYAWVIRRLAGRLTDDQLALIARAHLRLEPYELPLVAYREAWQGELVALLLAKPRDSAQLVRVLEDPEPYYPPEFQEMIDRNEVIYTELTLELLNALNPGQRRRFREELTDLAEICQDLIDAAGAPPPPVTPLVPAIKRS